MTDTELKIRIKPEMMAAAKGQLETIKGQAAGAGGGAGGIQALQGMKGMSAVGKMVPAIGTGMLAVAGIAAGMGIVVKALMSYKPLMNMISILTKVVMLFLRPIADVVITLLMPVLHILKPILMVANQLMAPYRRLAFEMLAQGGQQMAAGDVGGAMVSFGGAFVTMFAGLNAFIIGMLSEVLKLAMSGLGELLKATTSGIIQGIGSLLSFILGGVEGIENAAETISGVINSGIDFAVNAASGAINFAAAKLLTLQAGAIANMASKMSGVSDEALSSFVTGVTASLQSTFGQTSDKTSKMIEDWAKTMGEELDIFSEDMKKKLEGIFPDITPTIKGKSDETIDAAEEEQTSFWSKVLHFLKDNLRGMYDPIGTAIHIWRDHIKNKLTGSISGGDGLIDKTTKEFMGFDDKQNEIVSPIVRLVARVQAEVNRINEINVANVAASYARRRYSRSF